MKRRLSTGLLVAALLAAGGACAAPSSPKPLLWKLSDGDNSIYLLGSFHALKPADYPVAASVERAFADAEAVVFEVSPEEMTSPDLVGKMISAARLPAGQTLESSMPAASWQRLRQYAQRRGMSLDGFLATEPWFVAMVISLREMAAIGFDPQIGLDRYLSERAAKAGKRTAGLETADQQIAALDSMTPAEQQQTLSETLDEAQDPQGKINDLHAAWRRGDAAEMEQTMAVELQRKYAKLYKRINVDRNQAWLPKLRAMLDKETSDDTLVVVGSLHLLGSDGLVQQLSGRGYTVERL